MTLVEESKPVATVKPEFGNKTSADATVADTANPLFIPEAVKHILEAT